MFYNTIVLQIGGERVGGGGWACNLCRACTKAITKKSYGGPTRLKVLEEGEGTPFNPICLESYMLDSEP